MAKQYTDKQLIKMIKSGGKQLERAVLYLTKKHIETFRKFALRKGADKEMAKDAFNRALFTFIQKVQNDEFRGDSQLPTFLFGIARNKLRDLMGKQRKDHDDIDDHTTSSELLTENQEDLDEWMELYERLMPVLDQLSESCRMALLLKAAGYSNEEIAEKMGLKDANNAGNKCYKCRLQLMALLENYPNLLKDLNEHGLGLSAKDKKDKDKENSATDNQKNQEKKEEEDSDSNTVPQNPAESLSQKPKSLDPDDPAQDLHPHIPEDTPGDRSEPPPEEDEDLPGEDDD